MKRFFFLLLAAMLLGSASAFAQSGNNEPLKGDVNGDGKVDVADIAAVIEIMKNGGGIGGEIKYYWYYGTTIPTADNIASIAKGSSNEKPNWTSNPQSVSITNNTGVATYFYYCFPTEWNVVIYDEDKVSEMALAYVSTFTLNNVDYTVQRMGRKQAAGATQNLYAKTTDAQTYYWYAGQTKPESIDGVPDVDDTNFTNNKWHTLGTATYISQTVTGGTAGTTWKVAVPTTKSFKFYDNTLTELDTTWDKQSTGITVNGVSYDIWISRGTGAKTNVYMKSDAQIYYTYIGTDPSYKIVDADGNLTPNAADNIASMPGVKTSTTKPTSITSAYPSGTEVVGNGDYVYIVAINSAFNKSDNTKYFKTHNGNDVAMDEIGTFTKDGETYKILSTRVKVSGIVVQ